MRRIASRRVKFIEQRMRLFRGGLVRTVDAIQRENCTRTTLALGTALMGIFMVTE